MSPHPLDELDRPRTIRELARWLTDPGEPISSSQLFRQIKQGLIPVVRTGKRGMKTTARAYFEALTPKAG